MQFKNITRANIVAVEGKLFLELPDELIKHLNISVLDSLDVALDEGQIRLWKSVEKEIPQKIYDELNKLFKGNEQAVSKWLSTPRVEFEGKAAVELIDTSEGTKVIEDFIWRLKTGDFS